MWKTAITSILFFILVPFSVVKAGWYITEQSHDKFGNRSFSSIFIRDSIIRFDHPTSISIMNLNDTSVTLIFAQHRAYWHGTVAQLNRATSQMALEQLTKLLAYAPEQKKQEIKKAIAAFKKKQSTPDSLQQSPKVQVVNTGKSDTLLGYRATLYNIVIDSTLKQKVWVTRKVHPYHDTDINKILSFSRAMSPFAIENSLGHSKAYMALLRSGYILKSINYSSDGNTLVTTVTQIKKTKIPPAIFQVPPGYVESSLENIMILDMKNNILKPQNIAPDDDVPSGGLPPMPPPDNNNQEIH